MFKQNIHTDPLSVFMAVSELCGDGAGDMLQSIGSLITLLSDTKEFIITKGGFMVTATAVCNTLVGQPFTLADEIDSTLLVVDKDNGAVDVDVVIVVVEVAIHVLNDARGMATGDIIDMVGCGLMIGP
jgi:hypothetical protein